MTSAEQNSASLQDDSSHWANPLFKAVMLALSCRKFVLVRAGEMICPSFVMDSSQLYNLGIPHARVRSWYFVRQCLGLWHPLVLWVPGVVGTMDSIRTQMLSLRAAERILPPWSKWPRLAVHQGDGARCSTLCVGESSSLWWLHYSLDDAPRLVPNECTTSRR